MDYPARRRERLLEALRPEGVDALLVSNPFNVTYLTGFSGEASHLILGRDRTLLVSDFRFIEQLADECPGLETHIRHTSQPLPLAVAEVLGKLGLHSVGFESGHLTVADFELLREQTPGLSWKPGRDRIENLRMTKDPSEVAQIREAIAIAERAFTVFRALLQPADTEKQLCDALEGYIRRAGGWGASFPPIVAVGERAALPHAPPTDRAVGEAELVLVDWGASGRFYKSDLTRVLGIRRISPKLEEVYGVVLRAQERAIQRIRPGAKAHDVDAEARAVIAQAGFGEFFGHGLGHGFGLQIHEPPFFRPGADVVLEAGMVVTMEPGIYLPGWGGVRIEDDVLVTPDGVEVLTYAPRDLASLVVDW
jgi:Xaa-Pro aminopeptidase